MRKVPTVLLFAVFFIVGAAVGGCGGSIASKTEATLQTSLSAVNGARDVFFAWDKSHQEEIVESSLTQTQARDRLSEYREKQARVVQSFTVAYSTISAAAALLPLVEAGEAEERELVDLLIKSANAARAVLEAVEEVRK